MAKSDMKTTLNAIESDLSSTATHLSATMALPMRPVARTMVRRPIEIMNLWKMCEQSMPHQPSSAPVTGTPKIRLLLQPLLESSHPFTDKS